MKSKSTGKEKEAAPPRMPNFPFGGFPPPEPTSAPAGQPAAGGAFRAREYAFQQSWQGGLPGDSAGTVYWHPALVLPGGKPEHVSFGLSGVATLYDVIAFGHTSDGRLGAASLKLDARPATPGK